MTLIEIVLALGIALAVVGATLGLVTPTDKVLGVQTERADMHQRARVVFSRLHRDLLDAPGSAAPGGFVVYRPAVALERFGPDPTFRDDAVTIVSPLVAGVPAFTAASLPSANTSVPVRRGPACQLLRPACGLRERSAILIYDNRGRSDLLRVTRIAGETVWLSPLGGGALPAFPSGSSIMPVTVRSYYFDSDRAQIRYYDGWLTDVPLLDDVVGLTFRLYGIPPPTRVSQTPPEEPCVTGVGARAEAPIPQVELTAPVLTDGPWCDGRLRFDVDLLRVQRVRVQARVQAGALAHRGGDRQLFARPGLARDHARSVPDLVLGFDVSLRNRWTAADAG